MKLREVYGLLHNEDKYSNTRHKIQEILYEFCKPRYVRICIYLKKPKVEHAYLWVSDVKIRKTGEGNYSLLYEKGNDSAIYLSAPVLVCYYGSTHIS